MIGTSGVGDYVYTSPQSVDNSDGDPSEVFDYVLEDGDGSLSNSASLTITIKSSTLLGTPEPDVLIGSSAAETIDGLASDDIIDGAGGDDNLTGGTGNDQIQGGSGNDTVNYTAGDGTDVVDGGEGHDTLIVNGDGEPRDFLVEDAATYNERVGTSAPPLDTGHVAVSIGGILAMDLVGVEDLVFNAGSAGDTLTINGDFSGTHLSPSTIDFNGGFGADLVDAALLSSAHRVQAFGNGGADNLIGGAGNDLLDGGADNDTLAGGLGDDSLEGGSGVDTADYSGALDNVNVDIGLGTATDGAGGTDSLGNIEVIIGSDFADTLKGGRPVGSLAKVSFITLAGGLGDDLLLGADNSIVFMQGGAGNDTLDGGTDGFLDVADYREDPRAVVVNLAEGTAADGFGGTDMLLNLFEVRGSDFNDVLIGFGTSGRLVGGAGNDRLQSGEAEYGFDPGAVTINLSDDFALDGHGWIDSLVEITVANGSAFADVITGSEVSDTLRGNGGNDTINGLTGDDTLRGDAGDDLLLGGFGNDVLDGGVDLDRLQGGAGADRLTGGPDADIFVLQAGGGGDGIEFADVDATISLGGEFLAVVEGITPDLLTTEDFINVV
jgi:Ca2+-binding RTX toxin-like protein